MVAGGFPQGTQRGRGQRRFQPVEVEPGRGLPLGKEALPIHRRVGARLVFETWRLGEPQCQLAIRSPVTLHEILEVVGDTVAGDIAAGLYFAGDLFRKVFGPMLEGVEGDNPDRIVELARKQIGNDGFRIRTLNFGFTADAAG